MQSDSENNITPAALQQQNQELLNMINDLRNPQTKRHYKSGDNVREKNIREKEEINLLD